MRAQTVHTWPRAPASSSRARRSLARSLAPANRKFSALFNTSLRCVAHFASRKRDLLCVSPSLPTSPRAKVPRYRLLSMYARGLPLSVRPCCLRYNIQKVETAWPCVTVLPPSLSPPPRAAADTARMHYVHAVPVVCVEMSPTSCHCFCCRTERSFPDHTRTSTHSLPADFFPSNCPVLPHAYYNFQSQISNFHVSRFTFHVL